MKQLSADAGTDRWFARYVGAIGKFPMLEASEEQALACGWRDRQDRAALDRMVTSHLRLVAKLARSFAGYGMAVSDLVSVGTVGLMRAAQRFDPGVGTRFATYATYWIRAEIQQYVLDNWSLVRITRDATNRRLFFNLRRLKAELKVIDEGELDPAIVERIAIALGVSRRAVREMNVRLSGVEPSLNVALPDRDEEWQNILPDSDQNPEAAFADIEELAERRARLRTALQSLSERERAIIVERRISDGRVTLDTLSAQYGISRERVRQIENRALAKLKACVCGAAAQHE